MDILTQSPPPPPPSQKQKDPTTPSQSPGPIEATLIDLHAEPSTTDRETKKATTTKKSHAKMIPTKPLPATPKPKPTSASDEDDTIKINTDKIFEVPVTYESPTSVSPSQLVEDIQKHLIEPAFCDVAVAVKIRGQSGGCATVLALVEQDTDSAIFVFTLFGGSLVLTDAIPLVPGVVGRTSKLTGVTVGTEQQQQQQMKSVAFIELHRKEKTPLVFEAADPTSPMSSLTASLFEQIIPAKASSSTPSAFDLLSGSPHSWLKKYPRSIKQFY